MTNSTCAADTSYSLPDTSFLLSPHMESHCYCHCIYMFSGCAIRGGQVTPSCLNTEAIQWNSPRNGKKTQIFNVCNRIRKIHNTHIQYNK